MSSETVNYRAIDGSWWPAVVEAERPDGRLDLVVDDLKLSRIAIFSGDPKDCPKGVAMRISSPAPPGTETR